MNVTTNFLWSARVPRVGERVLAIADFASSIRIDDVASFVKSLSQHDAETSTRNTFAPQKAP
jgi:hypothetical protein